MKTLSFFCALKEQGCSFVGPDNGVVEQDSDWDEDRELAKNNNSQDLVSLVKDVRSPRKPKRACKGRLFLYQDKLEQYSIR